MIAVDTFMKTNRSCFSGFHRRATHDAAISRFHIPAMTYEEAADFCGYSDEDVNPAFSVVLPYAGQDRYDLRERVYGQMKSNPGKVTVIAECIHNVPVKVRHHPSYDDPFSVVRLCKKCHSREHARMAKRDKDFLALMIALKMFSTRRIVAVVPPSADSREAVTPFDRGTFIRELEGPTGIGEESQTPFMDDPDLSDPDSPIDQPAAVAAFAEFPRFAAYQQLSLFI